MTKREYRGCKCGCGAGTFSTYAPGHDAKHVARLVRSTVETWGHTDLDTPTMWRIAVNQLPSQTLKSKYRRAMRIRANKHLGSIVRQMESSDWQERMHLSRMVGQYDSYYTDLGIRGAYTLAEVAAAMGMTYHTVCYSRS